MRVLLATPRFAPQIGGAETWTLEVCSALAERGHRVDVVARAGPDAQTSGRVRDLDVRRVPGGRIAFALGIRRLVPGGYDVVIAQYSALAPAVASARRRGLPVVGIVHDVYGLAESIRIKGPAVGAIRHVGLERSLRILGPDAFLVPSRFTAGNLLPLARGRAVTVVPAGADHVPPDPGGIEVDPSRVVFVGRLVSQKGPAELLEAMRILRSRASPARAVVVGSGPLAAALRGSADTEELPVRFAGSLPWDELDRLIRGSAAVVLPSTREGWGLAVTEAAARGVPYVAYAIPALREQHDELGGGILVSPRPDALADAISELVADPERARALGRTGREAASGRTWAGAAEVVERALRAALDGAR